MASSELQGLYQDILLDHSRTPQGRGIAPGWTVQSHQHNPVCGDEVTLAVTLDGDRIASARWEGHGCVISQASASMLTGLAEDVPVAQARELIGEFRTALRSRGEVELNEERFGDAVALSGASRYVARVKCAMLAWVALEAALAQTSA